MIEQLSRISATLLFAGYEPHSVLPFGLPMVFGPAAGAQKAKLKAVHTLATSVVGNAFCATLAQHVASLIH